MELPMLLAVLSCLLATVMVFLLSYSRRVRAEATIHHIGDPAVAHRALIENAHDFSNRPAAIIPVSLATWPNGERHDNITTANYGPHWRALRCNLTAGILHPSRLASLAPVHQEAAQELVAALSTRAGRDVAIRGPVNGAVFAVAMRMCFGDIVDSPHSRRAMGRAVRDSSFAVAALIPKFDGSALSKLVNWRGFRQMFALFDRHAELFLPLIVARRQSRSQLCGGTIQPYIDSLLDIRVPSDNGKLDARRALRDGELVGLAFEFLGAATGSAAICVEWTLAHLISQPEIQEKLRREIDGAAADDTIFSGQILRSMPYLNAVVLESLRMHPPVAFIFRGVHGEGAQAIGVPSGGSAVRFSLDDIGRDKEAWSDPDKFSPDRFLAGGEAEHVGPTPGQKEIRMMPFGAGHRHCPAANLGMLQIKLLVATLVREFVWAPDCSNGGIDMAEQDGFLKVMKKPLSARLTRRT